MALAAQIQCAVEAIGLHEPIDRYPDQLVTSQSQRRQAAMTRPVAVQSPAGDLRAQLNALQAMLGPPCTATGKSETKSPVRLHTLETFHTIRWGRGTSCGQLWFSGTFLISVSGPPMKPVACRLSRMRVRHDASQTHVQARVYSRLVGTCLLNTRRRIRTDR